MTDRVLIQREEEDDDEEGEVAFQVFCDSSKAIISFGDWYHKTGDDYDLCAAEWGKLSAAEKEAFVAVNGPDDLGDDLPMYLEGSDEEEIDEQQLLELIREAFIQREGRPPTAEEAEAFMAMMGEGVIEFEEGDEEEEGEEGWVTDDGEEESEDDDGAADGASFGQAGAFSFALPGAGSAPSSAFSFGSAGSAPSSASFTFKLPGSGKPRPCSSGLAVDSVVRGFTSLMNVLLAGRIIFPCPRPAPRFIQLQPDFIRAKRSIKQPGILLYDGRGRQRERRHGCEERRQWSAAPFH